MSNIKSRIIPSRLRFNNHASRIALAAALLMAAPAFAQDGQAAGGDAGAQSSGIQTITVTAEFRKENVQDTPIAITAINSAMLEARSQTNVVEAATQAPNVTLSRAEGAFGNAITASIRGVGQYDTDPALEPGVGLYVDDVYYSQLTGSVLDLLDLDHVEVLRGPQGTLEGKNSIGGAVKLFSRAPTGGNTATVSGTIGDYNRTEFRGSGDFTLVDDKLFVRLSGVSKSQDGYVTRKDFACAVPTLTYTDVNGVAHTNVPNPIPSRTPGGNCNLNTEGGSDYTAERLMLRWLATDKIEDNFIIDYNNDNSEGPATTLLALSDAGFSPAIQADVAINGVPANTTKVPQLIPSDPYVSYAGFFMPGGPLQPAFGGPTVQTAPLVADDQSHLRSWGYSNTIDWQLLDNMSIKSITGYRRFTSAWSEDNDVSPLGSGLGIEKMNHWQISQEIRLSGDLFNKALEYTLGGFYFSQNTTYETHQDLVYTSPLFDFLGNDPVVTETKAAFLHLIWHVTDKLEIAGGLRYTDDEKTYTFHRLNADTFGGAVAVGSLPQVVAACPVSPGPPDCVPNYNWPVAGLDGASNTARTARTDWRAAVDYHWTPDLMTYFQFSTGFKGGGIDPRPFNIHQVLPFGPETLQAYEAGFKSTFWNKLRLNGAAFWNTYNNFQATLNNCTVQAGAGFGIPCALPVAAGDADVWGLELESEFHPFQNMEFDASGSYLHFKFSRITPGTGLTSNTVAPFTPTWKWSAGVQYDFDLGNLGTITPRFDVDYSDSFYSNGTNTPGSKVGQRTLANARLTWRSPDETLSAALEATNLADKFYYVNKFDLIGVSGFTTGQPGAPREVAFTIKKKF